MKPDTPDKSFAGRVRSRRPTVWLVSAIVFIGLSGLGLWVAAKLTGGTLPRIDRRLFEPDALALIAGFLIVYYLSDGLRLFFVLRALDVPVRFPTLLPLVFINILFSNVTPLASGGGFAQVWYLRQNGVPVGTSAAATSIRTILAMLAIFAAAPLFQAIHPTGAMDGMAAIVTQPITAVALLYLIGFGVLVARPFWLVRIVEIAFHGLRAIGVLSTETEHRWTKAVRHETGTFGRSFRQFLASPARLSLSALLWTLVFLLTLLSFPALLMTLLDYDVDWITAIGSITVVTFLMYFAPTPGGAGFAELAFAGLMFNQIGSNDLLLVMIAWRFLTIYLGMALGVLVSVVLLEKSWRNR